MIDQTSRRGSHPTRTGLYAVKEYRNACPQSARQAPGFLDKKLERRRNVALTKTLKAFYNANNIVSHIRPKINAFIKL